MPGNLVVSVAIKVSNLLAGTCGTAIYWRVVNFDLTGNLRMSEVLDLARVGNETTSSVRYCRRRCNLRSRIYPMSLTLKTLLTVRMRVPKIKNIHPRPILSDYIVLLLDIMGIAQHLVYMEGQRRDIKQRLTGLCAASSAMLTAPEQVWKLIALELGQDRLGVVSSCHALRQLATILQD